MKNIAIASPIVGRREIREVVKVLKSGALAQGARVAQFEKDFASIISAEYCVAVNSGTSALHVALLSLGVGIGDEVLVPSFSFAASANAICLTGATPVFVDIDPKTFNLDADKIESAITPKTKAIMVVHLYGLPGPMKKILEIANRHGLKIIEDAAQAHLAKYDGTFVGTLGDAAAFSFYPTKNMTSGEGGMVVLKSQEAARTAKLLRNQGMEIRYQNEIVGFNLRMTDIHAAIGISQLRQVEKWTEKRQENACYLSRNLKGVTTPFIPKEAQHVYHQYTIRVPGQRELFSEKLNELGIGNSVYYPTPIHKLPSFNSSMTLFETEKAAKEVLSIPVHPSLSKRDLHRITDGINRTADFIYG